MGYSSSTLGVECSDTLSLGALHTSTCPPTLANNTHQVEAFLINALEASYDGTSIYQ